MKQKILTLLLVIAFVGQAFSQTAALSPAEKAIMDGITIAAIKDSTTALSADDMQGRGTMQAGGEKAAAWIADRFKNLGLKPLGDKGSYLQKIEFRETVATPETMLKVGDENLAYGSDFSLVPQNNGNKDVNGEMVFIAYGVKLTSPARDDLAGVIIKGTVVVMLEVPPASSSKEAWKSQKAASYFTQYIVSQEPAAIIYIGHGREKDPPEVVIDYTSRRQITMPDEEGYPVFVPPFVYVGAKAAEKLFAKSGVSLKDALAQ